MHIGINSTHTQTHIYTNMYTHPYAHTQRRVTYTPSATVNKTDIKLHPKSQALKRMRTRNTLTHLTTDLYNVTHQMNRVKS